MRALGRLVRRWSGWLGLGALAGVLAFAALSLRHPAVYRATATVAVVSAMTGDETERCRPGTGRGAGGHLPADDQKPGGAVGRDRGAASADRARRAGRADHVAPVPGTNLLTIEAYMEQDGAAAARLANTVAEQFIRRATLERAAPLAAQQAALADQQAANEAALQTALTRQATLRANPARRPAEQQELDRLDADIAAMPTRTGLLRQLDALAQIQALNAVPARLVERAVRRRSRWRRAGPSAWGWPRWPGDWRPRWFCGRWPSPPVG